MPNSKETVEVGSYTTLRDYIEKNSPIKRNNIIEIIEEVAKQIDTKSMNEEKLRHIRLSNIQINENIDPQGEIKAKLISNTPEIVLTKKGFAENSDQYTPPEVMEDEYSFSDSNLDQSVLYILAIITFELFTGHHPLNTKNKKIDDWKKQHENIVPPKLSDIRPEIGSLFDDILIRALSKKPIDRQENINVFVSELKIANKLLNYLDDAVKKLNSNTRHDEGSKPYPTIQQLHSSVYTNQTRNLTKDTYISQEELDKLTKLVAMLKEKIASRDRLFKAGLVTGIIILLLQVLATQPYS